MIKLNNIYLGDATVLINSLEDNSIDLTTTAAMAIKNNRKWLGFESNLEYFKIACDRIKYLPKT